MHKLPIPYHGPLNPSLCSLSLIWSSAYYCSMFLLYLPLSIPSTHFFFFIYQSLCTIFFFFLLQTFSNSLAVPSLFQTLACYILREFFSAHFSGTLPPPEPCYPLWLHCNHPYNLSWFAMLYILISDCPLL